MRSGKRQNSSDSGRTRLHDGAANEPSPASREEQRILTIAVHVTPRSSRDALTLEGDDALRARLTAPPVEGAANEALVTLLAARLRLPKRAITIVRGASSRDKRVAIMGITADELRTRLDS